MPEPTPQQGGAGDDPYSGDYDDQGPIFREGPDGRVYQWDGQQWVPTAGIPGEQQPSLGRQLFEQSVLGQMEANLPLSRWQQAQLGVDQGNLGARYAELGFNQQRFGQEFEYQKEQDFIGKLFDMIGVNQAMSASADARRNAQRETLMQSAPYQTAGREFYGGFEPFGPAAALASGAGVPYQPRSTAGAQMPLDISAGGAAPQYDAATLALLERILG